MSADQMTSSTEQTETATESTAMDTSVDVAAPSVQTDDKPVSSNGEEQTDTENKVGKRKRSTKKVVETGETIANGRPKRNLSKREEPPSESVNSTSKASRAKVEQEEDDEAEEEEEQDPEKDLPVVHDVADVVWVKMGGHPWWPSLVIRDPNDPNRTFTKISGNARPKRLYFVVFYGSTADFAWVSDATIIAYQGVEAFTQYAQEIVDKAVTKSQKEQLTERFQLKVTIGRREDWESAVREADNALKQTSEKRLENIEPKIQFYTDKFVASKGQSGRRTKNSVTPKSDESKSSVPPAQSEQSKYLASLDPADRSLLAEKTFEFKSDDEDSAHETPSLRKTPSVKIKLSKQPSNDSDSNTTPPTKRRLIPKTDSVFGQTTNGSSVSYDPVPANDTTPVKSDSTDHVNGSNSSKKQRGRPRVSQPSASSGAEDTPTPEFTSITPSVTTKFTTQRKPIVKPQAFMNLANGQHDIRTGFLSSFEEQEVLDALEQLGPLKTFEEAEQKAKRRFEHILCLNLNRTHVDIPQEWFYTFLFSHPSIIIKNPQWFTNKSDADLLPDFQSSNGLAVLKQQLVVLSKSYRNQLQVRSSKGTSNKKRQSTSNKSKQTDDEEELIN